MNQRLSDLLLLAALLGGYGVYRATAGEHPTAVEAGLLVQGTAIFFAFAFVLVAKAYKPRGDELRVTVDGFASSIATDGIGLALGKQGRAERDQVTRSRIHFFLLALGISLS
ncbi:MAG TPA: hypothetical protein VMM76_07460 [Pirellulaceae bacterium]|nr:hypothetical protein [Pirellulaceae bacterium]